MKYPLKTSLNPRAALAMLAALLILAGVVGGSLAMLLSEDARNSRAILAACESYSPCYHSFYHQDECMLEQVKDSERCSFAFTHPDCTKACTCFQGQPQEQVVRCGANKRGICHNGGCLLPGDIVKFKREE